MLINTVNDALDIIVLAGQSNGEGYGLGDTDTPFRPTAKILSMHDTDNQGYLVNEKRYNHFAIKMPRDYVIGIAEERYSTTGKIGCFALRFAELYSEKYLKEGRRVLVIQAAVGSTGFAKGHWGLGEVLYERLLDMCREALAMNSENRIVAVLWHQGEHDAIFKPHITMEERREWHYGNLSALIGDFRAKFGTHPFIMGGFTDEWSARCDRYTAVLEAELRIKDELDSIGFADSTGLSTNNQTLGNGDVFHFSRNSLGILGERYFAEYEKLI